MLLLYRSASRSGGCYFDSKAAANDFYKAAEYYNNKAAAAVEYDNTVITEELNVSVVEKEVEAAAAVASVVVNDATPGNDGVMFSDEFIMPPDYLVSHRACNRLTILAYARAQNVPLLDRSSSAF